jgi:Zn-dependent peptidase ImmA (M78 family)/DNA-binding XRE family transcriptional regulator
MRKGVTGFQGRRLTQARESLGLTQSSLARAIGMSSAAISRWERGEQFPETDALAQLSEKLSTPSSWFLKPVKEYGTQPYFFRSQAAATKLARSIAKSRIEYLHEISLKIQEFVDLPEVNIPCVESTDHRALRDEDIELISRDLRRHWKFGLGPISDILLAMENAGVVVARDEIGYSNMDGLSKWFEEDSRPYVLLAKDKDNPMRQRFDTSHELGHLVLHRYLGDIEFNSRYSEIERQANVFASSFLMPAESFSNDVTSPSLDTFLALKPKWKVSAAAMISRSKQLGIISEDFATRLWKNYSARGWRKGEPGDDQIVAEQPRLLGRAMNLLIEDGGFQANQITDEICLSETDVERLASLPEGFFSRTSAKVVRLALKAKSDAHESKQGEPVTAVNANVIDIGRKIG